MHKYLWWRRVQPLDVFTFRTDEAGSERERAGGRSAPAQHDFSERLVGFHQRVRGTDFVEWENPIDYWLEPAILKERHAALGKITRQSNFFFQRPRAQHRAHHCEPLSEQHPHVELRSRARSETDHNDPPAQRHHAQVSLEVVPAHQIHQGMHALGADSRLDMRGPIASRSINTDIEAELFRPLELARRTRRPDYSRSRHAGDLQPRGSD